MRTEKWQKIWSTSSHTLCTVLYVSEEFQSIVPKPAFIHIRNVAVMSKLSLFYFTTFFHKKIRTNSLKTYDILF